MISNNLDRLPFDPAYLEVTRAYLAELGDSDVLEKEVIKEFRQAAVQASRKKLGRWIDSELNSRGMTQQELADRLGIDRTTVTKWINESSTMQTVDRFLLMLVFDGAGPPDPDDLVEVVIDGYTAAVSCVQRWLYPASRPGNFGFLEFYCLFHVYSRPDWAHARRRGPNQLRTVAEDILLAVSSSCGFRFAWQETLKRFEDLKDLVDKWEKAWLIGRHLIADRWNFPLSQEEMARRLRDHYDKTSVSYCMISMPREYYINVRIKEIDDRMGFWSRLDYASTTDAQGMSYWSGALPEVGEIAEAPEIEASSWAWPLLPGSIERHLLENYSDLFRKMGRNDEAEHLKVYAEAIQQDPGQRGFPDYHKKSRLHAAQIFRPLLLAESSSRLEQLRTTACQLPSLIEKVEAEHREFLAYYRRLKPFAMITDKDEDCVDSRPLKELLDALQALLATDHPAVSDVNRLWTQALLSLDGLIQIVDRNNPALAEAIARKIAEEPSP